MGGGVWVAGCGWRVARDGWQGVGGRLLFSVEMAWLLVTKFRIFSRDTHGGVSDVRRPRKPRVDHDVVGRSVMSAARESPSRRDSPLLPQCVDSAQIDSIRLDANRSFPVDIPASGHGRRTRRLFASRYLGKFCRLYRLSQVYRS